MPIVGSTVRLWWQTSLAARSQLKPSHRAVAAFAYGLCVLLLLAPALINGFPLLNYDTGGYLARWYEGTLTANRAAAYGLILSSSVPFALWPAVVLQSALSVWVIALVMRTHGLGRRPILLVGTVATLSLMTALPWLTSLLLTDIFCGLGVLALYLLLMRGDSLQRGERFGLILLIALAAATHSATLFLLIGLIAAAVLLLLIDRKHLARAGLSRGLLAIALAMGLALAANAVIVKRLAWTPAGISFPFGRLLQDGIVKLYLDEHCPDLKLRLCAYKDQLPDNGDEWFWDSPVFDSLGRFEGMEKEMEAITIGSLISYPALQAKSALIATAKQLIAVKSGEGILNSIWHTYGIMEHFTPQLVPAMRAARQQQAESIDFSAINRLHVPVALTAMVLLPVIALFAWRKHSTADIGELAAICALALLANAFVCGALSNPHDRYGARIVWIAVLTVIVAVARQPIRWAADLDLASHPELQLPLAAKRIHAE
jgi:hypothetical protein